MTSITLFHADWCGHCQQFKPVWNEIKQWCSSHGIKACPI